MEVRRWISSSAIPVDSRSTSRSAARSRGRSPRGLQPGEPLPSIRSLARDLRISVITTKRAYEDLERDGFITTVVGKGSFVRKADTRLIREEKLKRIERLLGEAVLEANRSGISREELLEILEIIYQER